MKQKYHNLLNKKFNNLTVVEFVGRAPNRTILWRCVCDCGNERIVRSNHLVHNHTTSCGCVQKKRVSETASFDLLGQKFGRLTVTKRLYKKLNSTRCSVWECKCDCGNITEQTSVALLTGHTKSCGCLYKENCDSDSGPYCKEFNFKEFKDIIKERDGYKCMTPGCCCEDILCVHHIDYNKKNCEFNNLITVCRGCNTRANYNRSVWIDLYQNILKENYGYEY